MHARLVFALPVLWIGGLSLSTASAQPFIQNPGFESVSDAKPGADGLYLRWKLGDPPQIPQAWSLNTAYPGTLTLGTAQPHSGARYVRLSGAPGQAHLFQACSGLKADHWYRVSLWARGGPLAVMFYEYAKDRSLPSRTVVVAAPGPAWRQIRAFYRPAGEGYAYSAIALCGSGDPVEVDDVSIEPLSDAEAPGAGPDVTFENDLLRMTLSSLGVLRELRCKPLKRDFAAAPPYPVISVTRQGMELPVQSITRSGDLLKARFVDPDVSATLKVTPRKQHIAFTVVDVQPADVESLQIEFPVKRLAKVAGAFNATYDGDFGVCLFGTTPNSLNQPTARGSSVQGLGACCVREHGMVGARFALVAAPYAQFAGAVMEAERENGLPCPILEGQWARVSEPVRKSYLFMVDASEANTDRIIEYAKIGGFGTIIFLKDNVFASHGHFDINRNSFPAGVESLKRSVRKIHQAGFDAGVHVFGPLVSPNDPYVTPVPDANLATFPCPPLAEGVDEKATGLTLTALPDLLPPKGPQTVAFPGKYLRLGDEIIGYGSAEVGPPYRLLNCTRGALGTKPAAHSAGTQVRGLLNQWGMFLVDPDSRLAEEVTANFARVFNECAFDMVYFDASDGSFPPYIDTWYYLNKMHLMYYRKFKKDVLYQTSMGPGSNLVWHIVPRSASADGHGDLKGYLDERLPGMLGMEANWTRPDVGWYYMFKEVRPDQIEYVCAKTLGLDGSISIESSLAAMESHPRARQMLEMVAQYERCRKARFFPESVWQKLKEPQRDFKLFPRGSGPAVRQGWELYRAIYEEPRSLDDLDGTGNVWRLRNDRAEPCLLGVEIARGAREANTADYDDPKALTIEPFEDAGPYQMSPFNAYERFVQGEHKVLTPGGPCRKDVTQSFEPAAEGAKLGKSCMVYSGVNTGDYGGWCGIGRRFPKPLDLSAYKALGFWMHGDGKTEQVRFQLWDTKGRVAQWVPAINYTGWRLFMYPLADVKGFDWSAVDYLLFYFNTMPAGASCRVMLDDLKALPELTGGRPLRSPAVTVNGKMVTFPVSLGLLQAVTSAGPEGVTLWPGGMKPGQKQAVDTTALVLRPGDNEVRFSCDTTGGYPGDVNVLLYRMWPME